MATAEFWRPYSLKAKFVRHFIPDLHLELRVDAELNLVASLKQHLGLFRGIVRRREVEIARILAQHAPTAGVIYDVGANIGLYTIIFAQNRRRRVVSFEPGATALRFLRRNVEINGLANVDIRQIVLSDHAGTCRFHVDDVTTATSHVSAPGEPGIEQPCSDLDSYVATNGIPPPDLIKLDVEGHEEAIIRGMTRIMAKHKPQIYLEGGIRDDTGNIRAVRQLENAGYRIFDYRKERALTADTGEYAFIALPA